MIKDEYFGKLVKIIDTDGKVWRSKVEVVEPAYDNGYDEPSLCIEWYGGLVEFKESEIKSIKVIE